jgi:hypothetical protein
MKKILLLLIFSITAIAQNPNASKYIQISYLKSSSYDFLDMELSVWKPVRDKQIEMGDMEAWYLYKVKYPTGSNASYDFIAVNVYADWEQLGSNGQDYFRQVHGDEADDLLASSDERGTEVWNQVLEFIGQAVEIEKEPSKYLQVNEMKVKPSEIKDYVNLELKYFKPFLSAKAKSGLMNNWSLYRCFMPNGEKYQSNFIIFEGYSKWNDVTTQNPSNLWRSIHGAIDFTEIQEKTAGIGVLINNELWELVDFKVAE